MASTIILFIVLILLVVAIFLFFRFNTWKPLMLDTEIDSKVNQIDSLLSVGMEGVTISRLAPMGKAIFENATEEVTSVQDFIDEHKTVVITKIEGNKIFVKLK